MTIGRMSQDFYLWATYEFGMLDFPDRVASTSSIMPQKKNLTVLENLKARPAALIGAMTTAVAALRAVPFGHSQEVSVEAGRWVSDAIEELRGMLPAARVVIECAIPRKDRMRELAGANFATAMARTPRHSGSAFVRRLRSARDGGAAPAEGAMIPAPVIEIAALCKEFRGGVLALDKIDLSVAKGEVVVVLGPSGSGKSTLIRCINGLEEITSGVIRVSGEQVDGGTERGWRRVRLEVGMVFQNYSLFPHLNVLRNISLAGDASAAGVPHGADRAFFTRLGSRPHARAARHPAGRRVL